MGASPYTPGMPRHLLQLEGLEASELTALLDRAEAFIPAARGEVSATPGACRALGGQPVL